MSALSQATTAAKPWYQLLIPRMFRNHGTSEWTVLQEESVKAGRLLRRLQLGQDNLLEIAEGISQRLTGIDQRLLTSGSSQPTQKKFYPFEILDELDKMERLWQKSGVADQSMTAGIRTLILREWALEVIDQVGAPYKREQSEVSAAIADPRYAPGTVLEIIQQGYLNDGHCVRKSVVVVSN